MNFTHFPVEFATIDDALNRYNEMGLPLKIQFKRGSIKRDGTAMITSFQLRCFRGAGNMPKINQGIQLKASELTDCQVHAKFRWCPDRMAYLRSRAMRMHHNHPIEIKDKHIISNKQVEEEIKLFIKCRLSVAQMQSIINKKFNVKSRYQDVYNQVKNLKRINEDKTAIKEGDNEFEQLLDMLNSYKSSSQKSNLVEGSLVKCLADAADDSPNIQYAYQLEPDKDNKSKQAGMKLESVLAIFIQFGSMKRNYQRFHEILFIDNTIKHKTPNVTYDASGKAVSEETNLILLSGINNEGKNVLFGFAILKDANYKSYKWAMKQFIEFSVHPKVGKVYPTTIIMPFDE